MVRTNPRVPVFRRAYSLDKWYWFWNRTGNGPVKCDRPFPLNKACGQYINQSVIWWRKKSTFNACGATITQFDGKNCQVATINVFQSIFLTTCPFPLNKACGQYINQSVIWRKKTARKSTFNACGAIITQFDNKNCQITTINVFQSNFLVTCPFPLNKACGHYNNQIAIWREKIARKSIFAACSAKITNIWRHKSLNDNNQRISKQTYSWQAHSLSTKLVDNTIRVQEEVSTASVICSIIDRPSTKSRTWTRHRYLNSSGLR